MNPKYRVQYKRNKYWMTMCKTDDLRYAELVMSRAVGFSPNSRSPYKRMPLRILDDQGKMVDRYIVPEVPIKAHLIAAARTRRRFKRVKQLEEGATVGPKPPTS